MRNLLVWAAAALLLCLIAPPCDANLAAMSIDIGSQFIKIGLVKPGVPMEVILNKESRRKTPNIVGFRNGERSFGDVAAQQSVKYPANTITFSLDLIGKQFEHPIVAKYQEDFPHLKLSAHAERNTVVFEIDGRTFEAETVLAMLLWNAREQTRAFAGQDVKDAVIAVPSFFNQTELAAVETAAKIAGINVLRLISNGAASALNYGVYRRKDIDETPQTLLIYNVGASSTIATLVEYKLVDDEDKPKEKTLTARVLGSGYDRTAGGRALTDRLRAHLVGEFRSKHKTSADITTNPRAMAKLWKEAERVKQVLSANTDHFAQVESLFEDKDFKAKVSRDLIEEFVKDQWQSLSQPLKDALAAADMQPEAVDAVVLMGAGTRVPTVQQILKDYFKGKDLGRSLNTDEAAALGAVYEAAYKTVGFKVKPFLVYDTLPSTVNLTSEPLVEAANETSADAKPAESGETTTADAPAPKKAASNEAESVLDKAAAAANATAEAIANATESAANATVKAANVIQKALTPLQLALKRQIANATRVLAEYERVERATRDHERALNDLESLVYDTSVRLDEDAAFRNTQFTQELKAVEARVAELRTWLDDDAHTANTTTLREKHRSLVKTLLDKHTKERKVIEEAKRKVIEEAKRKVKEEAERKVTEEAERNVTEEPERKVTEEAERNVTEEPERKVTEEPERKVIEEAEHKERSTPEPNQEKRSPKEDL